MVGILKACQVLVPREIKASYTRNPQNRELVTCVECISTAGEYLPYYICIKWEYLLARCIQNAATDGHDRNTVWTTTQSGYMDAEKALGWLEHFDQTSKRH